MNNVTTQLSHLAMRLGEPENADDRRFTPAQLLLGLNTARRSIAERTRSLQCRDSQTLAAGTKFINLPLDVIHFYALEWDGVELDLVPVDGWRETIGTNEDLAGAPIVAKYHARQVQVFPVPDQAKTIRYHGYCYPSELVIGGNDADFTIRQEEAAIWQAAADMKAADERPSEYEERKAAEIVAELSRQYAPDGPRYVKQAARVDPVWHMLRGGS